MPTNHNLAYTRNTPGIPREKENGGYFWHQGEVVELTWELEGYMIIDGVDQYIPIENILRMVGCKAVVKMFNYMGRKVKEWVIDKPEIITSVVIDPELADSLPEGNYRIKVEVVLQGNKPYTICDDDFYEIR